MRPRPRRREKGGNDAIVADRGGLDAGGEEQLNKSCLNPGAGRFCGEVYRLRRGLLELRALRQRCSCLFHRPDEAHGGYSAVSARDGCRGSNINTTIRISNENRCAAPRAGIVLAQRRDDGDVLSGCNAPQRDPSSYINCCSLWINSDLWIRLCHPQPRIVRYTIGQLSTLVSRNPRRGATER